MEKMFHKETAISLMRQGHKITHEWFSDKEWMTMKGIMIITEDGVRSEMDDFFSYRQHSSWQTGYSLYKD